MRISHYIIAQDRRHEEFKHGASQSQLQHYQQQLKMVDLNKLEKYRDSFRTRVNKQDLLNQLVALLGHSGMIHNFKNFLIRKDNKYRNKFSSSAQQAINILEKYKRLPSVTGLDLRLLKDIENNIEQYKEKIKVIEIAILKKYTDIQALDKRVAVDDTAATLALKKLNFILDVDSDEWFSLATQRIEIINNLVDKVATDVNSSHQLKLSQLQSKYDLYLLSLFSLLLFTVALTTYLWHSIRNSVTLTVETIHAIEQTGDLSKRIEITHQDEIGKIGKALNSLFLVQSQAIYESNIVLDKITHGVFDQQVEERYLGDLQTLAHGINNTVVGVKNSVEQMTAANAKMKLLAEAKSLQADELNQVLSAMKEGVILVDDMGSIKKTNKKLEEWLGWPDITLYGEPVEKFFSKEDKDLYEVLTNLHSYFVSESDKTKGTTKRLRSNFKSTTEWIPVDISITSIYKTENNFTTFKGSVIVIRDISEQIQIEQERQESAYHAGIAEMSSTVLHNIGNAVTPLIERSYQLREQGKDIIKIASIVEDAKNSAQTALDALPNSDNEVETLFNIINALPNSLRIFYQDHLSGELNRLDDSATHIADIVRVQQSLVKGGLNTYVEKFDLEATINEAITLISTSLDKRGIKTEVDIKIGSVILPHNPFIQMVNNLIKNAKEAIDTGSNAASGVIKVSAVAEGENHFCLAVSDNGCGITTERKEKVFSFGHTSKSTGSGFGLHSVANFVQSLNGKIRVESDGVNKGATFFINLPIEVKNS